jgi:penicillin-binding protein 1C
MRQNISERKIVSGGSTISMQVIRLSRSNPSRTIFEKMTEMVRAARLESRYSKNEILKMYAANAPMGGNVVGLDAAAWRYFGRPAHELTWSETCTLAVLPNAPGLIFPGTNQNILREKRNRLLALLHEAGYMDETTYSTSLDEPLPDRPKALPQLTPHLLQLAVKSGLKGTIIQTSIDKSFQIKTSKILDRHISSLKSGHINNAAAVVIDIESKEVVAYVGNCAASHEDNSGSVDIVQAPRSTGSILKPLLYAHMLNDGEILPHTLVPDIPVNFGGYSPENYQRDYSGAVPASMALSRSLNIPCVLMLQQYGIDRFLHQVRKMGLKHLDRSASHYGLSVILGGGEASLWEVTSAYTNMANTLSNYTKLNGEYRSDAFSSPTVFQEPSWDSTFTDYPVLKAASIYHTFESLLSVNRPENETGWEQFNSSVKLAWKTGTSFGYRDAWAVGTDGKYCIGIWVGNADGEGRPGIVGVQAAAPILFDVVESIPNHSWFDPPYDEMTQIEICSESGCKKGAFCPESGPQWVTVSGNVTTPCTYHKMVHVDKEDGLRANLNCTDEENLVADVFFVLPAVQEWYYKVRNPRYRGLPELSPHCADEEDQNPIGLIYPKNSTRIYLPTKLDRTRGQVVIQAAHRDPEKTIYWHLNDVFVGESKTIHNLELSPLPGVYELTLVDEDGMMFSQSLEVLSKEAVAAKN